MAVAATMRTVPRDSLLPSVDLGYNCPFGRLICRNFANDAVFSYLTEQTGRPWEAFSR